MTDWDIVDNTDTYLLTRNWIWNLEFLLQIPRWLFCFTFKKSRLQIPNDTYFKAFKLFPSGSTLTFKEGDKSNVFSDENPDWIFLFHIFSIVYPQRKYVRDAYLFRIILVIAKKEAITKCWLKKWHFLNEPSDCPRPTSNGTYDLRLQEKGGDIGKNETFFVLYCIAHPEVICFVFNKKLKLELEATFTLQDND